MICIYNYNMWMCIFTNIFMLSMVFGSRNCPNDQFLWYSCRQFRWSLKILNRTWIPQPSPGTFEHIHTTSFWLLGCGCVVQRSIWVFSIHWLLVWFLLLFFLFFSVCSVFTKYKGEGDGCTLLFVVVWCIDVFFLCIDINVYKCTYAYTLITHGGFLK